MAGFIFLTFKLRLLIIVFRLKRFVVDWILLDIVLYVGVYTQLMQGQLFFGLEFRLLVYTSFLSFLINHFIGNEFINNICTGIIIYSFPGSGSVLNNIV